MTNTKPTPNKASNKATKDFPRSKLEKLFGDEVWFDGEYKSVKYRRANITDWIRNQIDIDARFDAEVTIWERTLTINCSIYDGVIGSVDTDFGAFFGDRDWYSGDPEMQIENRRTFRYQIREFSIMRFLEELMIVLEKLYVQAEWLPSRSPMIEIE